MGQEEEKERPGDHEEPEQDAVGDRVEDPLDDDRADGEARPQALLAGQIHGPDQLAQAAGDDGVDGEADGVGREQVAEADVGLLPGDEHLPAEGPGDEVEDRQGDGQEEQGDADVDDLGRDLFPGDAAAEEIEEDDRQDDADREAADMLAHGRRNLTTIPN